MEKQVQMSLLFQKALAHAMLYEVGAFFNPNDDETRLGLITTPYQRKKCGYVNDPDDRGGETKYGVAKNANQDVNISTLTWDQAMEIYYKKYWIPSGAALIQPRLAVMHFDIAVNHGVGRAGKFLQGLVGFTDKQLDGDVGKVTAAAVLKKDELLLIRALSSRRMDFYNAIVANNPSQSKYIAGWSRRNMEVTKFCLDPASNII